MKLTLFLDYVPVLHTLWINKIINYVVQIQTFMPTFSMQHPIVGINVFSSKYFMPSMNTLAKGCLEQKGISTNTSWP
jgi:hypothetical protein